MGRQISCELGDSFWTLAAGFEFMEGFLLAK